MTRITLRALAGAAIVAAGVSPAVAQTQGGYSGHGADSVPREKIAKYAPPPLPVRQPRRRTCSRASIPSARSRG